MTEAQAFLCAFVVFFMSIAVVAASARFDSVIFSRKWRAGYKRTRALYHRECELIERGYSPQEASDIARREADRETARATRELIKAGLEEEQPRYSGY